MLLPTRLQFMNVPFSLNDVLKWIVSKYMYKGTRQTTYETSLWDMYVIEMYTASPFLEVLFTAFLSWLEQTSKTLGFCHTFSRGYIKKNTCINPCRDWVRYVNTLPACLSWSYTKIKFNPPLSRSSSTIYLGVALSALAVAGTINKNYILSAVLKSNQTRLYFCRVCAQIHLYQSLSYLFQSCTQICLSAIAKSTVAKSKQSRFYFPRFALKSSHQPLS